MNFIIQMLRNKAVASLAFFYTFCCGMLLLRILYLSDTAYLFLVWNLFLAVLPLKIAVLYKWIFQNKGFNSAASIGTLLLWLIFFPNSPYIITDLIHIANSTGEVPLWYDALMIFSFAMSGVYAGFLSLYIIYKRVKVYLSTITGILLPAILFLLSAYGIYLGRVLRWNSWDLVTRPHKVAADVIGNFTDPAAWGITVFFGFFLIFAWYIFSSFAENAGNRVIENESDKKYKEF